MTPISHRTPADLTPHRHTDTSQRSHRAAGSHPLPPTSPQDPGRASVRTDGLKVQLKASVAAASTAGFDLLGFTVSISVQQTASNGRSCEAPQSRRSLARALAAFSSDRFLHLFLQERSSHRHPATTSPSRLCLRLQ